MRRASTAIRTAARSIEAALARAVPGRTVDVRWTSDIPRSVGLAGSSAIVVATLRALARPGDPAPDPLELAKLALLVEQDLGIVAGLQDRAVQATGEPVLVDVAGARPIITPLRPARPVRVRDRVVGGGGGRFGSVSPRAAGERRGTRTRHGRAGRSRPRRRARVRRR